MASHYNNSGQVFAGAARVAITGREAHLHVYAEHQVITWKVIMAVVTVKTVVVLFICMPCIFVVDKKTIGHTLDTQFLHWSLGTQKIHQLYASI